MFFLRKISRLKLSLFLGVFLWMLSAVMVVSAHGVEVVKSNPVDGAALAQSPEQVKVWFNEELQTGDSILQVIDAKGTQVDMGNGGVDLDDPEHASMKVDTTALPAGAYIVKWHVVLTDGDASDGEFGFTVGQNSPAGQSYPPPVASSQQDTISQYVPAVSSYPAPVASSQQHTSSPNVPAVSSYPPPVVASQKFSAYPISQAANTVPEPTTRWLVPGLIGGIVVVFGIIVVGMIYLRKKKYQ
jgi:methionine-rich copper-binding protein CopC